MFHFFLCFQSSELRKATGWLDRNEPVAENSAITDFMMQNVYPTKVNPSGQLLKRNS